MYRLREHNPRARKPGDRAKRIRLQGIHKIYLNLPTDLPLVKIGRGNKPLRMTTVKLPSRKSREYKTWKWRAKIAELERKKIKPPKRQQLLHDLIVRDQIQPQIDKLREMGPAVYWGTLGKTGSKGAQAPKSGVHILAQTSMLGNPEGTRFLHPRRN